MYRTVHTDSMHAKPFFYTHSMVIFVYAVSAVRCAQKGINHSLQAQEVPYDWPQILVPRRNWPQLVLSPKKSLVTILSPKKSLVAILSN